MRRKLARKQRKKMVTGLIMIQGAEVAVVAEAAVVEEVMEIAGEVKVIVAE